MEAKLAEYRARKSKERQACEKSALEAPSTVQEDATKYKLQSAISARHHQEKPSEASMPLQKTDSYNHTGISHTSANPAPHPVKLPSWLEGTCLGDILAKPGTLLTSMMLLKVILWFIFWGLFVELEFGAVYFVITLLVVIYTSMKPGSRRPGELSAYSVFNPNCERLDGTFTAEQFERELRYGAGSVR